MAAYAAVVTLKHKLSGLIDYGGLLLSKYHPSAFEILQFLVKELKSFQEFVERLDQPEVMLDESDDIASLHYEVSWDLDKSRRDLQDQRQMVHSFIDTLKKMEEEYLKVQVEDESHVDSGGKMVGLSDEYSKLKRVIVSPMAKCQVVSLVGMIGIGKTTLAKKLFEDLDVLE